VKRIVRTHVSVMTQTLAVPGFGVFTRLAGHLEMPSFPQVARNAAVTRVDTGLAQTAPETFTLGLSVLLRRLVP
jgi:hypothetical protein